MENLRFEESFKDAFNGAELAPSSVVWTNVELGLEKKSNGKMRGLLFFQLLAAASMVFAMGTGGVYFLNTKHEADQQIAKQELNVTKQNQNNKDIENQLILNNQRSNEENKSISENTAENESLMIIDPSSGQAYEESEVSLISGKRTLPSLVEITAPTLKSSTNEPDPGMVMLAKLRDEEKRFQQERPEVKEKLWASVGMGAGTFNPSSTPSNSRMNALSDATSAGLATSNPTSGTSYSVGVSVAGKVSKRMVLQGGISYLNQNSTYTSSTASGTNASLSDYASISKDEMQQVTVTSPYQLNNNLQYISIPLQAGYILIDRTLGLQVNGGISTDVFFRNTLTPENSDLDEVSQGGGSDSPYRTMNFSGLLGTELSYKMGDHYRIAVNPGMRYALNSIYKNEIAAEVSPITFDVALRVRYVF